MKVQAIIPTAGTGERLNSEVLKPFIVIGEQPIFIHTLKAFEDSSLVDSIILVGHPDHLQEYEKSIKDAKLSKVSKIIPGGATRSESVQNGMKMLDNDTDCVLVHDGARPVIATKQIDEAIAFSESHEAVIVAVPVKPTIKKVNKDSLTVEKTLNRAQLWEIQTPQIFKRDTLTKAHAQANGGAATDDAMLVEKLGVEVKVFEGDYRNIKITTQEDIVIAKALLEESKGV